MVYGVKGCPFIEPCNGGDLGSRESRFLRYKTTASLFNEKITRGGGNPARQKLHETVMKIVTLTEKRAESLRRKMKTLTRCKRFYI